LSAIETLADPLAQFGVAGLMGVLWVWERMMSRRHERQLAQAHQRLVEQRYQLKSLIRIVSRNTAAIERFDQTQSQLKDLLETIHRDINRRAA